LADHSRPRKPILLQLYPKRLPLRDSLDLCAEAAELVVDALVAAVDLLDVADRRGALRAKGRQHQRHAGANVGAGDLLPRTLSSREGFDLKTAYAVEAELVRRRRAQGRAVVGRKVQLAGVRALELHASTGVAPSVIQRGSRSARPWRVLQLALDPGREALALRIDRRCEAMIAGGLLQEVRNLRDLGYGPELPSMRAIGYRHMQPVIDGLDTLAEMKRLRPELAVVMISGHATIRDAVDATRAGAFDFLEKPLARDRVLLVVRNALERSDLHFHRVVVPLAVLARLALAADPQDALIHLDAEVLSAHPGDVDLHDQLIVGFVDVGARLPFGRRHESDGAAVGDFVEIDVQLIGEVNRERTGPAPGPIGRRAAFSHGRLR